MRFTTSDRDWQEEPTDEWWDAFDLRMEQMWDRLDALWGDADDV